MWRLQARDSPQAVLALAARGQYLFPELSSNVSPLLYSTKRNTACARRSKKDYVSHAEDDGGGMGRSSDSARSLLARVALLAACSVPSSCGSTCTNLSYIPFALRLRVPPPLARLHPYQQPECTHLPHERPLLYAYSTENADESGKGGKIQDSGVRENGRRWFPRMRLPS